MIKSSTRKRRAPLAGTRKTRSSGATRRVSPLSVTRPAIGNRAPSTRKANRFSGRTEGNETWLTPPALIKALGPFDLDPATPPDMPWTTATRMLTKADDGLATPWPSKDFTFCNPPYGRDVGRWLEKSADHGNGIALIFARTETLAFQTYAFGHPNVTGVFFIAGRLKFCRVDGTEAGSAGAPSVLVAYGREARRRIREAARRGAIDGTMVEVRKVVPCPKRCRRRSRGVLSLPKPRPR